MPYSDPERQREFQRQWMKRRRDAFLADKKCAKCGTKKNLILWGIKITNRKTQASHTVWSYSPSKQREYLSKSEILCRTCKWGGREVILAKRRAQHVKNNRAYRNRKKAIIRQKVERKLAKHNLTIEGLQRTYGVEKRK